MDATIRATCPNCQAGLKIPAKWAGQAVKCKKCGAVVRTKGPVPGGDTTPPPGANGTGPAEPLPLPENDFVDLGPARQSAYNPFDPAAGGVAPPPPYDPAGYHPAAYGPPPGYPYPAPPPGYPYPVPPGYGPPPGYPHPAPPGYPYPMPPGYAPPQGYPQPAPYDPAAAGYPAPVPGYHPPAPVAPAPVPPSSEFKPGNGFQAVSAATAAHSKSGGGYRRGSGNGKVVWIGLALFLTAGLVAGVTVGVPYIKKLKTPNPTGPGGGEGGGNTGPATNPKRSPLVTGSAGLPRRLLFIHVSNYLYLNPLTSAEVTRSGSKGPDLTRPAADRLAHEWRVPRDKDNNQVFVVADKERPMKSVILGSYKTFFETSRAQDRIVVYYGGHVVGKKTDEKHAAFLVPMEGDPDDAESLIPLDDFYGALKACPATQKVVIWDVARLNPDRGRVRPGSEPMSEEVAKLLTETAPAGTQVVLTCQPGENALEFNYLVVQPGVAKDHVAGSSFLGATLFVKGGAGKNLGENDPIPVDEWTAGLGKKVSEFATLAATGEKGGKFAQTVKVYGAIPKELVAANKEEAPAKRFDLPAAPKGAPVTDLVAEFALPPIDGDDETADLGNFPFPEADLLPYKADVSAAEMRMPANKDRYAFQLAVMESFDTIKDVWGDAGRSKLRKEFVGAVDDRLKKEVSREQDYLAIAIPRVEQILFRLEAFEPMRAAQPKRWQAHYDYAAAQAKARLAYLHEYNLALGNIRTEVLPARDMKLHDGYKLIQTPNMKVKKEKQHLTEAHEIFDAMITSYRGTPWAIVAKRDRALSLGLAWQPFKKGTDDSTSAP